MVIFLMSLGLKQLTDFAASKENLNKYYTHAVSLPS
jgi:hypothetical protein